MSNSDESSSRTVHPAAPPDALDLFEQLEQLLPSQFAKVLLLLRIPENLIAPDTAPLGLRAIHLVKLQEQQGIAGLTALRDALESVRHRPDAESRPSGPPENDAGSTIRKTTSHHGSASNNVVRGLLYFLWTKLILDHRKELVLVFFILFALIAASTMARIPAGAEAHHPHRGKIGISGRAKRRAKGVWSPMTIVGSLTAICVQARGVGLWSVDTPRTHPGFLERLQTLPSLPDCSRNPASAAAFARRVCALVQVGSIPMRFRQLTRPGRIS